MNSSIIPVNEAERLAAVRRYDILDTPPDGAFDRITAIAAEIFKVPIAIVSIVDEDRIWFKSHHGLDVTQIDRAPGLCASAILQKQPWVVTDAVVDPRTLTNPLVAGSFGLRFYAACPLITHDGFSLGTLCVIDKEPRHVTEAEMSILHNLAGVVMDELELRLSSRKAIAREATLRKIALQEKERFLKERTHYVEENKRYMFMAEVVPDIVWTAKPDGTTDYFCQKWCDYTGLTMDESLGWGWGNVMHPDDFPIVAERWLDALMNSDSFEIEYRLRSGSDGTYRWFLARATAMKDPEGNIVKWVGTCTDIQEQKCLTDELYRQKESYRFLADLAPSIVWTSAPDGNLDYYNKYWYDYTELSEEESIATGWLTIIHSDDQERANQIWMNAVKTGQPYAIEIRLKRASDQSYRWFLAKAVPMRDEAGRITKWFGTTMDIHDQKTLAEEINRQKEHFQFLSESLPQIIWTALPDGSLDYHNQRLTDYVGRDPKQNAGTAWHSIIHEEDLAALLEQWQNSIQTGRDYEVMTRFKGADLSHRWHLVRAQPMRDHQGQIIKWIGTAIDVHEQMAEAPMNNNASSNSSCSAKGRLQQA